ncbi:MAG: periplasmic heavy metal sensor [Geminicoccaceae bacterium]
MSLLRRHILPLALLMSVAANIFFGARMAGEALSLRAKSEAERTVITGWLIRKPTATDHGVMHEVWRARRMEIRPALTALKETQNDLAETFMSEPFDPEAAGQALGLLRQHMALSQQLIHEALLDVAVRVDAKERRLLIERGLPMQFANIQD